MNLRLLDLNVLKHQDKINYKSESVEGDIHLVQLDPTTRGIGISVYNITNFTKVNTPYILIRLTKYTLDVLKIEDIRKADGTWTSRETLLSHNPQPYRVAEIVSSAFGSTDVPFEELIKECYDYFDEIVSMY